MSRPQSLLCASLLILSASSANAAEPGWVEVEVPPAPPQIYINGAPLGGTGEPKRMPIVLKFKTNADGSLKRPANVGQLVDMLHEALPTEYRRGLAAHYGFATKEPGPGRSYEELRLWDLESYLGTRFSLFDGRSLLGRQMRCLTPGEGSISPVLALVVAKGYYETHEYVIRPDLPKDVTPFPALLTARTLAYACRKG